MDKINKKERLKYYKFLNSLTKKINKLYFGKLRGKFKLNNKSKKRNGFDPVTNIDKALELFLRKEIKKKFPKDGIIGEEFKEKKTKSGFSWILDPIDGTRSFIIGSPTWSNLISINYNNEPILGLVNFPMLKKYYITGANNSSYLVENNKFKKLKVIRVQNFYLALSFFKNGNKRLAKEKLNEALTVTGKDINSFISSEPYKDQTFLDKLKSDLQELSK